MPVVMPGVPILPPPGGGVIPLAGGLENAPERFSNPGGCLALARAGQLSCHPLAFAESP